MEENNKTFWDKYAFIYSFFTRNLNPTYNLMCKEIKLYLKNNDKVIELACGDGYFSKKLCDTTDIWIASDFSENMIKQAKRKCKNKHIEFKVLDAKNTNFESNEFDVVFISNALHILPNPELVIKEIYRILKPEGIVIAPNFIYEEGTTNKLKLKIYRVFNFKDYTKFSHISYIQAFKDNKFEIISSNIYQSPINLECLLVARKPSQ